MTTDPVALGRALRQRRIELGLTQDEIAEGLGISRTTVSKVERGQGVQMSIWLEVAGAVGLDVLLSPRHSREAAPLREQLEDTLKEVHPHARIRRIAED